MTKWKTAKHFTSWLGLSPNVKRSGGKDQSMNTRKVQSRAALAFRHAARAVSQSHSYLDAFYRRLRARCGPSKALTATARKLAVIFYHMGKEGKKYQELVFLQVFIDGLSVPANLPVRSVPTGMSAHTHPSAKTCKSTRARLLHQTP